jgi:MFS superfamily sulfate permease-like transporter/CRP-like cAMP-binding protein
MSVPSAALTPSPNPRRGWAEIRGGIVGSLAVLAVPLSLGLLAFSALGAQAAPVGLMATFVTATVGGVVYGLASRARTPAAGSSSATALVLAALVASLLADPRVASGGSPDLPRVLACCALAVALSGLLQMAFALAGLARLARLVPRPVLAGFMNGVSLLILVGQLPLLLGLQPGSAVDRTALGAAIANPGALLLGSGTVVFILALQRRQRRWPAALIALALGTLLAAVVPAQWPGLSLGPLVGSAPLPWPGVELLAPLMQAAGWPLLADHAGAVLTTALVLALIGGLESLLSLLALDEQLDARHDPKRELLALGLCNLACGLLGGMPAVALRARATAMAQAGGLGASAAVAGSLAFAAVYLLGAPLLAQLPLPVLGGIMVTVAFGLFDRWSAPLLLHGWRGEVSADLRSSLAVMLLVCGMTLWLGFAAGVALGILLSMLIFVARMNRSLLRSRLTAAQQPSRRIYPATVEALLQPLRRDIDVWELEGALFFGNADRLVGLAESLDAGVRALVLDLRRVGSIDETAAAALARVGRMLARRPTLMLLAGLTPGSPPERALLAQGITLPRLPDADRATEVAEQHVLGPAAETTLVARPLEECDLLRGLAPGEVDTVRAEMTELRLFAGQPLFRQGDPADGLYVLTLGSVSVIGHDGSTTQRYLSLSPGMMVGETAMLDGGGRSADAVADGFATLHHLSGEALHRLQAGHPAIAARLHRNIAVHLSRRLRAVSLAWSASRG